MATMPAGGDPDPTRPGADRMRASLARRRPAPWRVALSGDQALLDLRIVGRTLLHAGAVGVVAGVVGAAFFAALELAHRYLLGGIAGFEPVKAYGETFVPPAASGSFRPWLLALLAALGGLASGLLTWRFASEVSGGGGDAAIEAYHHGGILRRRVRLEPRRGATGTVPCSQVPVVHEGEILGWVGDRELHLAVAQHEATPAP